MDASGITVDAGGYDDPQIWPIYQEESESDIPNQSLAEDASIAEPVRTLPQCHTRVIPNPHMSLNFRVKSTTLWVITCLAIVWLNQICHL